MPAILENPTLASLRTAVRPPPDSTVTGRPVLNLSLALNHALGGYAVWGYHAFNVAVHIAATLLLFGLVRRTLERAGRARRARPVAFVAALLWAVHPLNTEAVAYISQRAESLMGLFYLFSLYAFARGAGGAAVAANASEGASAGAGAPGRVWLILSCAACLLGMAAKETMASAPLVIALYDRTFVAGSVRAALIRRPFYYAGLAASWLLLAILMHGIERRGIGGGPVSPWHYALTECRAVWLYLRLAVWPAPLVFDYGTKLAPLDGTTLLAAAGMLALLGATAWAFVRRPIWGFFAVAFFLLLAPTSSVIPVIGQPVAEHRMYLPLAVLASGLACILMGPASRPVARVGLALAAGLALATAAHFRNQTYRSELSLWRDTAAKQPDNARAQNNLGEALTHAGDAAAALASFQLAVSLDGRYAEAHSNLAGALESAGRSADAVGEAEMAVRLDPELSQARYNLGNALRSEGDFGAAIDQYRIALRLKPDDALGWNNLGIAEAEAGNLAGAADDFAAALRIDPNFPQAEFNLGNVLRDRGKADLAAAHYRAALRLDPNYGRAAANLRALEQPNP